MSVFQITIFFLYMIAGSLLAISRLPARTDNASKTVTLAFVIGSAGFFWHAITLWQTIIIPGGLTLSMGEAGSFIGLQLALVGLLGALEPRLRGLAGGLFILAALISLSASLQSTVDVAAGLEPVGWQIKAHVLISLFAYGLLSVGAIVAIFALLQENRLQAGKLSSANQLFAPLETTERLLFGITSGGFFALLLAVFSGFVFVDNLFAQHLVHKTALSLLALALFGILLSGRQFFGWRGKRAVYLYLWGFLILCLAYFGSRFVLEEVLGRSWS